ncbi:MAG: LamG-like jellyroll fold domain-containing protein [Bacteroidota bacterium]|nr:LamG-like jellyroll fold domain-containing protein [Bacteroidota bacterium]
MRKFILTLFVLFVFGLNHLNAQTFNWGLRHGGTGADLGRKTTTDAQNNLYTLVFYYNNLTIDSAGTPKVISNYGNRDIAVLKYDCNKVFQWALHIGGTFVDGGAYNIGGLVVDTLGNLYVSCSMNGSTNFVSANGNVLTRNSLGGVDAFLFKANTAGQIQWINQIGGAGNDEGAGVTLDANQNVYSTGIFFGTATFTSVSGPTLSRTSMGNGDIFFCKYDPTGAVQIATRGGSFLLDIGADIAIDSSGGIYVAGNFSGGGNSTVIFGGNFLTNTGGWGGFVAKADASGNWLWGIGCGTGNDEAMQDVVIDEVSNRIFVVGHFTGTTTLTTRPGGTAQTLVSNGAYDAMIASVNFNGGVQWARRYGGSGNEYGFALDLNPARDIVVCGQFSGTANFGGITLTPSGTASGYYAKYSQNNLLLDAQKIGTGTNTLAWSVHVGTTGKTYVTGYYTGTINFGTDTLISGGNEDAFIARMDDADTTFIAADHTLLSCLSDSAVIYLPNKTIGNYIWFKDGNFFSATNGNLIKTIFPGTYKAISVNYCAVFDTTATVTITKSAYYAIPGISDINICRGDSALFAATGGTNYTWSPATGLSNAGIPNPFVKPVANTTYNLTVTQGICTAFDTVIVSVNPNCCLTCTTPYELNQGVVACYPFTGNARDESGNGNNASIINANPSVDRFGTPNRAYQFNGFNSYIEIPNSVSLQSPTTNMSFSFWAQINNWNVSGLVNYTPILSKSNSTAAAQYRAMVRSDGAYAMANGSSWNAVVGSTTNLATWYFFTITVSNDTLRYYRNGVLLGFARGPTAYTLSNTTPLRLGRNDVNTLAFFNGRLDEVRVYGRTISAAEVLKLYNLSGLNGLPSINAGADKNMCVGDSVYINTVGSNGTFLWTPATGLNYDTIRNVYCSVDTTTVYAVTVDVYGCKNRDTIVVNTVRLEPYAGADQSICLGDTATLSVINGGNTYSWSPNYNITTITAPNTKVYPAADTNYIVLTNNGLCARRDTVRVQVNIPTVNAGIDQSICKGDTAFLNITTNGTARWSPLTYLSDSIGISLYSVPDTTINYVVTANYLGCLARDTVMVQVVSLPIDGGPDKILCFGDSVQLQATGGGLNYIWIPNYNISDTSVANPWVKPAVTTKYFVISYNLLCARFDSVLVDVKQAAASAGPDKTICNGDSVQIFATVIGPHSWSPAASLSDTSLQPYAKPLATTDFILSVNNSGCLASDTVKVNIVTFNISAGPDKVICKGDSVQLVASGGTKYNWLPLYNISDTSIANPYVYPAAITNYYVISSNGICIRVDTVVVDIATLSASAGTDTSMCEGQSLGLKVTGGSTYQWLTAYNIDNLSTATPIVTPAIDTNYIVKIGNGGVCFVYDTVFVEVNKYPTVNAGPDLKHCLGDLIQIQANVTDYTSLLWSPATGLSDMLTMQPFASVSTQTIYILGAFNGYCFNSDTVIVTPNPKVVASFQPSTKSGNAPLQVLFTNTSVNTTNYSWSFGDGSSTVTDYEPVYTYLAEGTYIVELKVTDNLGCRDSAYSTIVVGSLEHLFAPSAFSPNKDGLNDEFRLVYDSTKFDFVSYEIYNRWGVRIFETKLPGGLWWDGTSGGQPNQSDIYSYVATAKDKKGKTILLNGTVALTR